MLNYASRILGRYGKFSRGSVVVKALCYKPEGRGFEIRGGEYIFSVYLILPVTLGPGFTQPLTEILPEA
jgi:hypothetical protein